MSCATFDEVVTDISRHIAFLKKEQQDDDDKQEMCEMRLDKAEE